MMLKRLLSDDFPRSRVLAVMLVLLLIALAGAPFIFPGVKALNVAAKVLIFIVIIIGGLGSTGGALIGALLVGLMANYTGFLLPKVALFSNIALMVAILLWRPRC